MKQGLAFFLLAISILLAMVGGTFLYRKAFEKEKIYYIVTRLDIGCKSSENALKISIDPYINVFIKDSLVKEDAEPQEVFVAKDSLNSIAISILKSNEWSDASMKAVTSLTEMDAATGRISRKILDINQWKKRYNHDSKSTRLKDILVFEMPADSLVSSVSVTMKFSSGDQISDTCYVK